MLLALMWNLLNSVTFVTSTFSKTETNYQPHVYNECYGAVLCARSITDLKIITTMKGIFRVVSNISYDEIVCLLETSDSDEKFGYLYEVV